MTLPALAVAVTAVFFAAAAFFTRAGARRLLAAVATALVVAVFVLGVDAVAGTVGLWRYPGSPTPYGPLETSAASGLGLGAVALVTWRLARRFGDRAYLWVVVFFAVYGPIRDYVGGMTLAHLIEFAPGPIAYVADTLAWAGGVGLALAVLRLVGGPARADPLRV